ncbi:MAG TPA: hypothetical protein VKA38_12480 [Draconibacterium sp.]|nr:hypothetical protein [Draconibacterium sp.]
MNQKENKGGLITREGGAVWNINVGVLAPAVDSMKTGKHEIKLWKIKVILN